MVNLNESSLPRSFSLWAVDSGQGVTKGAVDLHRSYITRNLEIRGSQALDSNTGWYPCNSMLVRVMAPSSAPGPPLRTASMRCPTAAPCEGQHGRPSSITSIEPKHRLRYWHPPGAEYEHLSRTSHASILLYGTTPQLAMSNTLFEFFQRPTRYSMQSRHCIPVDGPASMGGLKSA